MEVKFVSATREDHVVKIVVKVKFMSTASKDRILKTVVEVKFVSTTNKITMQRLWRKPNL